MTALREIRFPVAGLVHLTRALVIGVVYAGLCAEVWDRGLELGDGGWVEFFSLSEEKNFPTWIATGQLLVCAGLLAFLAATTPPGKGSQRRHWALLALLFAYVSLDEFVQLHEHLNAWFDYGGVLFFGWVIPAAAAVAVLGVVYLRFLLALPAAFRWRFVIAALLFVGGALGVELWLGWWTDREGDDNFTYAMIDWLEEGLELSGVAFFLVTLVRYAAGGLEARAIALTVSRDHRGEASPSSVPPATSDGEGRRPGLAVLVVGWALALGIAGAVVAGGLHEVHLYSDAEGHTAERDRYVGGDLGGELRSGARFRHAGTELRFEDAPEARARTAFALGALALAGTGVWAWRRADRS